jgi:hypothetical protein
LWSCCSAVGAAFWMVGWTTLTGDWRGNGTGPCDMMGAVVMAKGGAAVIVGAAGVARVMGHGAAPNGMGAGAMAQDDGCAAAKGTRAAKGMGAGVIMAAVHGMGAGAMMLPSGMGEGAGASARSCGGCPTRGVFLGKYRSMAFVFGNEALVVVASTACCEDGWRGTSACCCCGGCPRRLLLLLVGRYRATCVLLFGG